MTAVDSYEPRVVRAATSITMNTIMQTQLRVVREAGFQLVCVCDDDAWAHDVQQLDVEVVPLGMGRRPGVIRGLIWAIRFYVLLRRARPQIVHTHNAFHGLFGRPVAKLAGVPVVVQTIHNWWYLEPPKSLRARLYSALERFAARFSDAVLFINRDDVRRAVDYRIVPEARVHFIGNGIDVQALEQRLASHAREHERSALGLGLDTLAISMIARLEHPKDHGTLLRAFARLTQDVEDARLILAGQGLEEVRVRALAGQLGITDATMFLGHVDDISTVLAASDVLVLTSHCEGFGRCLVEGMVAGLPVIGTDVVGIRDVIRDNDTGLICPAGDSDALYDVLKRLALSPELRAELGARGRTYATREFDETLPAARIVDIYRSLLDSARWA